MYRIILVLLISIIILISCKSPYCTEIDQTQGRNLGEQAEILVQKLLDYPNDMICILENEKYIDCYYYLNKYYKMNSSSRKSEIKFFKLYAKSNCKITGCVRIPRNNLSNPEKETELGIIIIYISDCQPCLLNPWSRNDLFEYFFEFNIIHEQKLELISLGPYSM